MALSEFFELLLKSCIFSSTADLIFQFFVGEAWGERRIMFWKFNGKQHFAFYYPLRSLAWKGYPSTLQFIATQRASDRELYDIGAKILYETCFIHNSTQKTSTEELQVRFVTKLCEDAFFNVKTCQNAISNPKICMRPWIRRYPVIISLI